MNEKTKISEDFLVATADCPKCLSKNTLFSQFNGELICPDNSKPAEGVHIFGEIHKCKNCSYEFEKNDGPWIGLELVVWVEAMKHNLPYERVIDYTSFINKKRSEEH